MEIVDWVPDILLFLSSGEEFSGMFCVAEKNMVVERSHFWQTDRYVHVGGKGDIIDWVSLLCSSSFLIVSVIKLLLKAVCDPILLINCSIIKRFSQVLFESSNVVEVFSIVEITEKLSSGRVAWGEAGLLGELGK